MSAGPLPQRTLIRYARPEAFSPKTEVILARLGYTLLSPEDLEACGENQPPPDLRIVDERQLADLDDSPGDPSLPMILLTGRMGVSGEDRRVVGALRKPAGLHDLYRLIQQLLEDHPRSTPRVPTHLRGTCLRNDEEWSVAMLSLSENGCLVRSQREVPLGSSLDLAFDLPRTGPVIVSAEVSYQLVPDLGLVFNSVTPDIREAIGTFVADALFPS